MGQYWKPVNIDKREFIHPHDLDEGLKLWEIVANKRTMQGLSILLAAMPVCRGGGDLPPAEIIGRWAGDRVAIVGDYAEDGDIAGCSIPAPLLYALTYGAEDIDVEELAARYPGRDLTPFRNISADIAAYLEANDL